MNKHAAGRLTLQRTMVRLAPGLGAGLAISLGLGSLMLAVPIYSMQLFDRALSSGHAETLLLLTLIVGFALLSFGALETVRTSLLARIGTQLGQRLIQPLVSAAVSSGLQGRPGGGQLLRDLASLRQSLTGPAVQALFDAPWLPLAALAIWHVHPELGLFALVCAVLLAVLAFANEWATRRSLAEAGRAGAVAQELAESAARKAELVEAMGMLAGLAPRIGQAHDRSLTWQQRAAELSGVLMGLTRSIRLMAQAGVLGLGAWLVLRNELSPGMMIAASILLSRALAPVEQLIGAWRSMSTGREAARRISEALASQVTATPMPLPAPTGRLELETASVTAADGRRILRDVTVGLAPGEVLGLLGASAAGKSTLCRLVAGIVPCAAGHVRLDGAQLDHYDRRLLGQHLGYLPQEPMLFAGSVAENIARMVERPDPELVVEAARLAGVHDMILRLPKGYDTLLLDGGAPLSGGQRQRIGLARALYGRPRLVVLDEPNANLDGAGDLALKAALEELKRQGTTVVLATHRPNVLMLADKVMLLEDGAVERLGPRDAVLASLLRPARPAPQATTEDADTTPHAAVQVA